MTTLQSKLETIAVSFAAEILNAVRSASLDELVGGGGRLSTGSTGKTAARTTPTGRLRRRSEADLAAVTVAVINLLKKSPSGLRAEQIRTALGVESKELPKPLAAALESGQVKKKGNKRATTYFAVSKKN